MTYEIGDRVRHPARPDWGPGEVLASPGDGKVEIYFAMVGQKTLKGIPLEKLTGSEAAHPLLDNRIRAAGRGAQTRSIAELKSAFLRAYSGGFSDPDYLTEERTYKVAAAELLAETMSEATLKSLIEAGEFHELCKRALHVVNATNLIFPNEKMALKDGLASAGNSELFARSLSDLLYGTGPFEARFVGFCDVLAHMNAAKWTTATYFPFLSDPKHQMFLKPVVTQIAAEACNFELSYRPELNWETYRALLRFCDSLAGVIADLSPRDNIDLQSFIWVIGGRI